MQLVRMKMVVSDQVRVYTGHIVETLLISIGVRVMAAAIVDHVQQVLNRVGEIVAPVP